MNVNERNLLAKEYVNAKIGKASNSTFESFPMYTNRSDVFSICTDLIETNVKGFRGIVLTAIVGMQINNDYDPLNQFYDCNPRSIFENGIWYALNDNNIPCGKSDPLNVAKNINQLNESWAQGKRPHASALAVVKLLRIIISKSNEEREKLIDYFFFRLFHYSKSISNFQLIPSESLGNSNRQLANKILHFILAFPEAGSVPQFLIGKLLENSFKTSKISVHGSSESVFGTNTTSKKPADIWTEFANQPLNLFEVTLKKIDIKRVDDCIEALIALNNLTKPVTFICRIPEDVQSLDLVNDSLTYKGKTFDFVDIREFVISISTILRPESLVEVVDELHKFVNEINVSMKTKDGWNSIFG